MSVARTSLLHSRQLSTAFVPPFAAKATKEYVDIAAEYLSSKNVLVVTGAGISTESGIPDYRSPVGSYSKALIFNNGSETYSFNRHKPMTHQEFINNEGNRKRYWARAVVGSNYFYSVKPNKGHFALAVLEKYGFIKGIITQNVDRLHQAAGSKHVVELHGHSHAVFCLSCAAEFSRQMYHESLARLNRDWFERHLKSKVHDIRADGDAHLINSDFNDFQVIPCDLCNGILMPKIVFFGGTVPRSVKDCTIDLVRRSTKLLVVGSSLSVFSSFRLCKEAKAQGKRLAIVNVGETRADSIADIKLEVQVGDLLDKVVTALLT